MNGFCEADDSFFVECRTLCSDTCIGATLVIIVAVMVPIIVTYNSIHAEDKYKMHDDDKTTAVVYRRELTNILYFMFKTGFKI